MRRFRGIGFLLTALLLAATITGCALFNRAPIAVLSASPTSGGTPLVVQFSASGSYDPESDALTYAWDFGDGTTGSGVSVAHEYTAEGSYSVTLTVTDVGGMQATASQSILVTNQATGSIPTASFTASPSSGGTPLTVAFNAAASSDPDGTIVSYEWSFGDGATGSGATVTHSYLTQGTYTAALTVTDDEGLTDTSSQTIVVIDGGQGGCS